MGLTDTEQAMLDAAGRTHLRAGDLERALVGITGLSPVRAYQMLNALLSRPEAWEYAPMVCARLDRQRNRRRRVTSAA